MPANGNVSAAQNYGIPQSDPGSQFAMNRGPGAIRVRPYTSATDTSTRGRAMQWDNPQMGGGSFMKFDDGAAAALPSSLGS